MFENGVIYDGTQTNIALCDCISQFENGVIYDGTCNETFKKLLTREKKSVILYKLTREVSGVL